MDGQSATIEQVLGDLVENGLGSRVAFHWRGEEGAERDVTYEQLTQPTSAEHEVAARGDVEE
jgi:acyl-coenzyme A synthetase/AMP-(fatty) acid ligase